MTRLSEPDYFRYSIPVNTKEEVLRLRRAIVQSPDDPSKKKDLLAIHLEAGYHIGLFEDARWILELDPDFDFARMQMAASMLDGEVEVAAAVDLLEQCRAGNLEDEDRSLLVRLRLVAALLENDAVSATRLSEEFQLVSDEEEKSLALVLAAWSCVVSGDSTRAAEVLGQASVLPARGRTLDLVRYHAGRIHLVLGMQALGLLRQAKPPTTGERINFPAKASQLRKAVERGIYPPRDGTSPLFDPWRKLDRERNDL